MPTAIRPVNGKPNRGERIAKRLARAGLCSRREAEAWIRAGRVAVDGNVLGSPAVTVTDESVIAVDGKPLPAAEPTRMWRYHKPAGRVTTTRDPQGRPKVFDQMPANMPRVISVGRLDFNSEGLLLLTNDGELARRLELPATGWLRRYRVRVRGQVDAAKLEALADGIKIDGIRYGPIRARLDRQLATNAWLTVALAEGRNREVRRVCEHLGWPVLRLIRLSYGPFQLGSLARGEVAEVPARVLREQLGGAKAQAGSAQRTAKKPSRSGGEKTARTGAKKPTPLKREHPPAGTVREAAGAESTGPTRRTPAPPAAGPNLTRRHRGGNEAGGEGGASRGRNSRRSGHAHRRRKT